MSKKTIAHATKKRSSGIELLKLLAIIIIVIFHVCFSLGRGSDQLVELSKQLPNISNATPNIHYFLLTLTQHLGPLGNDIFIICSCWFLCDSKKVKLNKVISIMMDVYFFSILFFIIYSIIGEKPTMQLKTSALLPNLFGVNWFITCYVIFYLLHPFLVTISDTLNRKTHCKLCIVSFFFYCIITFYRDDLLYYNNLILFIVLFFIVSFMKKYANNWSNTKSNNQKLLIIGVIGTIILFCVVYYLGLKYQHFNNKALITSRNNNPFIVISSIALFNLFRQLDFYNPVINHFASFSLLIYIIHENLFFRRFTRIRIWAYLLSKYDTNYIALEVVLFSLALFLASYIISIVYKFTIQRLIFLLAEHVTKIVANALNNITDYIFKND